MTVTLPNHTSQVTGRRIDVRERGHGVTWNTDLAGHTDPEPRGRRHRIDLHPRARGRPHDRAVLHRAEVLALQALLARCGRPVDDRAGRRPCRDPRRSPRPAAPPPGFHVPPPRCHGRGRPRARLAHLPRLPRAARLVDAQLGTLLKAIREHERLAGRRHRADGRPRRPRRADTHDDGTKYANYRIPFVIWRPGVVDRGDLYAMNPTYDDPGTEPPVVRRGPPADPQRRPRQPQRRPARSRSGAGEPLGPRPDPDLAQLTGPRASGPPPVVGKPAATTDGRNGRPNHRWSRRSAARVLDEVAGDRLETTGVDVLLDQRGRLTPHHCHTGASYAQSWPSRRSSASSMVPS